MACEKCFILKLNVATIVSYLSSSDFPITEALTLNISNSPARGTPIHAAPSILTHSSIFSLIFTLQFLFFFPFSLYPPCTHLVSSWFISFFFSIIFQMFYLFHVYFVNLLATFFFLLQTFLEYPPEKMLRMKLDSLSGEIKSNIYIT